MTTVTTGMFFLARQRPTVDKTADGAFRLVMRVKDNQGAFRVEPYVVTWTGEQARAWWAAHEQQLPAGTPLRMELHNPRSMPGAQAPETHASVHRCELAPVAPSWAGKQGAQASA